MVVGRLRELTIAFAKGVICTADEMDPGLIMDTGESVVIAPVAAGGQMTDETSSTWLAIMVCSKAGGQLGTEIRHLYAVYCLVVRVVMVLSGLGHEGPTNGTVVRSACGGPLANVTVCVHGPAWRKVVDEDGKEERST